MRKMFQSFRDSSFGEITGLVLFIALCIIGYKVLKWLADL